MENLMETEVQTAPPAIEENLNFFSIPAQDVGVLQKRWVSVRPINSITDQSAIEFNIEGNKAAYIDLQNTTVVVKFKVLKHDGSAIQPTEEIAPINLFLATMFRQVDIALNYENLKNVNVYYPYKAMFDTLLFTTEGYKKSQLKAQLFEKDEAGLMDSASLITGNDGYIWRRDQVASSRVVQMEGNLFLDFCQQERLLLNGCPLSFKFWPASDPFKFMSSSENPQYKVEITEMYLKLCLVTVNPAIIVAQREVLQEAPAVYPFTRSDIRAYSVAASEMNLTVDNLFNGEVPHFLCVGIVATSAFNGDYQKNPFNFANYDLSEIGFYVDGCLVPGEKPYKPNFDEGIYTEPYLALSCDKKGDLEWNNGIYLEDFAEGYAIYTFNIRSETELKRRGLTRLKIDFKKVLPEAATILVYAQFPDLLQIDRNSRVIQS